MPNFNIKTNLLALNGAFMANVRGKKSIIIPVKDAHLFLGEKGCYLDSMAKVLNSPKYEDTHYIRQSFTREAYEAMSQEVKDALPIIGNMRPAPDFSPKEMEVNETISEDELNVDEDLPFR